MIILFFIYIRQDDFNNSAYKDDFKNSPNKDDFKNLPYTKMILTINVTVFFLIYCLLA